MELAILVGYLKIGVGLAICLIVVTLLFLLLNAKLFFWYAEKFGFHCIIDDVLDMNWFTRMVGILFLPWLLIPCDFLVFKLPRLVSR